jgi:hypothetical protein
MSAPTETLYKGFTRPHLEWAFDVRFTDEGVVVPYRGVNGEPYREKLFSQQGRPLRWLGEAKPQIPYGLETLSKGSSTAFVTEGESCAWALRVAFPHNPVIGLPGASSWKPEWLRLFAQFPVLYLSFDGDEAGRGLLGKVRPELPSARTVKCPEGADTRDVLQLLGGLEEYERLLDDADYMAGIRETITAAAKRAEVPHVVCA